MYMLCAYWHIRTCIHLTFNTVSHIMHSYRQDDDSASCSASDDEEKTDVKAPATEKGTCVQSGDKLLLV